MTQNNSTETKQFRFSPTKPFYAWVGASDLALEAIRKGAADLQLQLEGRLNALQADAKALPERTQARLVELRTQLRTQLAETLVERRPTFDELAARGHSVVAKARVETSDQVQTAAEAVQDTAAATQEVVDDATQRVQDTAADLATTPVEPNPDDEVVVSVTAEVDPDLDAPSSGTAPAGKPSR